jgi:hypothetical protein
VQLLQVLRGTATVVVTGLLSEAVMVAGTHPERLARLLFCWEPFTCIPILSILRRCSCLRKG